MKKFAAGVAGVLLLITPLIAAGLSIEGDPNSPQNAVASLQYQVQILLARLAQLQSQQSGGTTVTNTSTSLPDDYGTSNSGGTTCPNLSTTFQRGARDVTTGGQVSALQLFLANHFDLNEDDVVSGYFGPTTQKYVVQFQSEQGLPSLGIVGSLTRAAIAKICGGSIATPPPSSSVCPPAHLPACEPGTVPTGAWNYNDKGCASTPKCVPSSTTCPQYQMPICAPGYTLSESIVLSNGCIATHTCVPSTSTNTSTNNDWPSLSFSPLYKAASADDAWAEGLDIDGLVIEIKNSSALQQQITFPTNCWYTYKIYNRVTGAMVFDLRTIQQCVTAGSVPPTTFTLATGEAKYIEFKHENRNFHLSPGSYEMRVDVLSKIPLKEAVRFYFRVTAVNGSPSCTLTSNKTAYTLGEIATFSWTSTNATYAAFIPDTSGKDAVWVPGDKLSANGSQQIALNILGNPTVTLGVYGLNGWSGVCKSTVSVTSATTPPPAPTPTLSISISPTVGNYSGYPLINSGVSTIVSWTSSGMASCTIKKGEPSAAGTYEEANINTGWSGTNGQQSSGALTSDTIYFLRCVSSSGQTYDANTRVYVTDNTAPTVTISAGYENTTSANGALSGPTGKPISIYWSAPHASSCTLSRNPAGTINGTASGTYSNIAATIESQPVTYTVNCLPSGSASVTVSPMAAPSATINASSLQQSAGTYMLSGTAMGTTVLRVKVTTISAAGSSSGAVQTDKTTVGVINGVWSTTANASGVGTYKVEVFNGVTLLTTGTLTIALNPDGGGSGGASASDPLAQLAAALYAIQALLNQIAH
jgi:hypothetical protein